MSTPATATSNLCDQIFAYGIFAGVSFGTGCLWGAIAKTPVLLSGSAFTVAVIGTMVFGTTMEVVAKKCFSCKSERKVTLVGLVSTILAQVAFIVAGVALGVLGTVGIVLASLVGLITLKMLVSVCRMTEDQFKKEQEARA